MPIRSRIREEAKASMGFVRGFREFISQYQVVPLAVAVVIGNAVNDLVKSVVANLITPLLAILSPDGWLQGLVVTVRGADFGIGAVVNAFISFLVVAWLVYITAKLVLRNDELLKK